MVRRGLFLFASGFMAGSVAIVLYGASKDIKRLMNTSYVFPPLAPTKEEEERISKEIFQ